MAKRILTVFILLIGFFQCVQSQSHFWLFEASYAQGFHTQKANAQYPVLNVLGGGLQRTITPRFLIGLNGNFQFSSNINNELLKLPESAITSNGTLTSVVGSYRGWEINLNLALLFPLKKTVKLMGSLSNGFISYKTQIQTEGDVPQFFNDKIYSYDNLSNGYSGTLFIGITRIVKGPKLNFLTGIVFNYRASKNRRGFYLPTGEKNFSLRNELYLGYKFAFLLPSWISSKDEIQFYK